MQSSISIHPMLKLIKAWLKSIPVLHNFNTSHVKVNLIGVKTNTSKTLNFNTSHVKVNQKSLADQLYKLLEFQYIPC